MLNSIFSILEKFSTNRILLVMGVIYFIFPLYLLPSIMQNTAASPLDLQLFYNANKAYGIISAYSEETRIHYIKSLLSIDLLYPIYYSILISLLCMLVHKKLPLSQQFDKRLTLSPFFILIFDYCENSCIIFLVSSYPDMLYPRIAVLSGLLTFLKWSSFIAITGMILFNAIKIKFILPRRR